MVSHPSSPSSSEVKPPRATNFNLFCRDYAQLLKTFTKDNDVTVSYTVRTKAELDALLKDETFNKAEKMQLVEIVMLAEDAPAALSRQTELGGKTNKYGDPE